MQAELIHWSSLQKDGLQCTKTAETEIQFTNPLQAYINQSPNINCAVDPVSLIGGATLPGPNRFHEQLQRRQYGIRRQLVPGQSESAGRLYSRGHQRQYGLHRSGQYQCSGRHHSTFGQCHGPAPLVLATTNHAFRRRFFTGSFFTYAW